MPNTDPVTQTALSAVLSEANAQPCLSCGARAAVRVLLKSPSAAEELRAAEAVWFCFECGHEERAID